MIFALDIGTRSVIGIVAEPEGDTLKLIATEYLEHTERAMRDGQIENIPKVMEVASKVKSRLEEKLSVKLTDVSIAAAGRSLRTQTAEAACVLSPDTPVTREQMYELELMAIEAAHDTIRRSRTEGSESLACVGYSVLRYHLDGYPLDTLELHKGSEAKVKIIATFLPGEVVESLHAVMSGLGMRVESLTLEPIAAMNVVIPKELRLLNLALVDIGAGTSDIAISRDQSIVAYTMATVAGDEITEALVKAYLIDFTAAETVKRKLSSPGERISFTDILGQKHTVTKKDVARVIEPAVDALTAEIASQIVEANGGAPSAVFLVGGGSLLPRLSEKIARELGLEQNKVAVGGTNFIKKMVTGSVGVSGPEYVTPVGIALTAHQQYAGDGFTVTVNDRRIRLFKKQGTTVMDVLVMCGYQNNQILGRAGASISFTLDGERHTRRGGHPAMAVIEVNGSPSGIGAQVKPGDIISFTPAVNGQDAQVILHEVVSARKHMAVIAGRTVDVSPEYIVGAASADLMTRIKDGDRIDSVWHTLMELCIREEIEVGDGCFFIDGKPCALDRRILPGETVDTVLSMKEKETAAPRLSSGKRFVITLNGEQRELADKPDGYVFLDMLGLVDIDPKKPEGDIVLRLNGETASYLEPLKAGDRVEIFWDRQGAGVS